MVFVFGVIILVDDGTENLDAATCPGPLLPLDPLAPDLAEGVAMSPLAGQCQQGRPRHRCQRPWIGQSEQSESKFVGVATPAGPRGEKTIFFCANFGR